MSGESSYIIHPGSVDCCLQSIIVSIYTGKLSSLTHGFVPIGFDSVTIWTNVIHDNKESSKINTWVYDGSGRYYSASSQLRSNDGRLALDLQGVHCVAYEAAVPQSIQESQQDLPYWRMQWMPDLGLIPLSEALKTFTGFDIVDVVTLLCHNNASTRILDVGGNVTADIVKSRTMVEITASVPVEELLQSKKDALERHDCVKVVKLDISNEELDSSFDAPYDLIVASEVL